MAIIFEPIGYIHSPHKQLHNMPIQPSVAQGIKGYIELNKKYTEALSDLDGFSHIYILYIFHKAKPFQQKVTPYLEKQKRGLFSTRAPQRPNPIGLSVVRLISIEKNILQIENIDALDGTPLIDIKPYVNEMEALDHVQIGWLKKYTSELDSKLSDRRFT